MFSNSTVVSHHHLVVQLRALADHRGAIGAAVNRRPGTDIHMILDSDKATLSTQDVMAKTAVVPKSECPNRRVCVNDAIRSNFCQFIKDRIRIDGRVGANGTPFHDAHARIQGHLVAESDIWADVDVGKNRDVIPDLGGGMDLSCC